MSFKKRYSCVYIPSDSNDLFYFELTLNNKDLNNIVYHINSEFNVNFIIDKSFIDDNYGILLLNNTNTPNLKIKNKCLNANLLFITHAANLDDYVKKNDPLKDKANLDQIYCLLNEFIELKLNKDL